MQTKMESVLSKLNKERAKSNARLEELQARFAKERATVKRMIQEQTEMRQAVNVELNQIQTRIAKGQTVQVDRLRKFVYSQSFYRQFREERKSFEELLGMIEVLISHSKEQKISPKGSTPEIFTLNKSEQSKVDSICIQTDE